VTNKIIVYSKCVTTVLIWFGAVVCILVLGNFLVPRLSIRMGGDTLRVHISDLRQTIYGSQKKREREYMKFRNMINRYKSTINLYHFFSPAVKTTSWQYLTFFLILRRVLWAKLHKFV